MSSTRKRAGLLRPATLALASVTIAAFTLGGTAGAQTSAGSGPTDLYIVQVTGAPVAAYTGGLSGYAATKPAAGVKLNAHTPQAKAYGDHLKAAQKDLLRRAGVDQSKVAYQYDTSFNGVAVRLTSTQAQKLQSTSGVVQVWKSRTVTVDTPPTPKFLGLTGNQGVWKRQFGGDANAGNGVIIGVIDTGFWPESPSFAPLPSPRSDDAVIAAKWHGTCDAGDDHQVTCNNKVIGARWFNSAGLASANPGEYHSPRDFDGHGSHTASTAAGDHVFNATINGTNVGDLEGVAPGARIAVYKVLYERNPPTTASGTSTDIVKAIDQAVEDGVDILSYSVSGSGGGLGPEEQAFLNAAGAGVFVSAAAGNAGPGASTVDNAMPWETTVAAGSFDQAFTKTVTLGDGQTFTGVGVGAAVASSPLIDAATAGLPGQTATAAARCFLGALDPAKVAGKIVLCQRGTNNRIDKSKEVQLKGGVGMILYNPTANSLNADFHFVPTIHVDSTAGAAIKTYIAGTASPTASLSAGVAVTVEAPSVAAFSSRGPSLSSGGGLLKPDIMGPGVDVIAAVSPSNHNGNLYDTESGTSMSTPHISGVAALILSKHPNWGPMWVKSAIMTGAAQLDNMGQPISTGAGAATPFDMGSGEVDPARTFDPGLVYDSGFTDWLRYSCGIGVHLQFGGVDVCTIVGSIAPSDLNYPSIAVGDLAGIRTVTRTVTNVSREDGEYKPTVVAPAGYTVKVSPRELKVKPGRTASYTVTITRTTAAFGGYAFGSITWKDDQHHSVRSPIAVQSVPIAVTGELDLTGTSGSQSVAVRSGFTGSLTATANGLVPATVDTASLVTDTALFDPNNPAAGPGTREVDFTVPASATLARVQTFASDYATGTDVDLFVYAKDAGGNIVALVGQSAGGTASELVDLPAGAGSYAAFVDLFNNPAGTTSPLNVKTYTWAVSPGNAGNITAAPASQPVTLGGAASVTVGWSGLAAGQHYLGYIEYGDGTNVVGTTLVTVAS